MVCVVLVGNANQVNPHVLVAADWHWCYQVVLSRSIDLVHDCGGMWFMYLAIVFQRCSVLCDESLKPLFLSAMLFLEVAAANNQIYKSKAIPFFIGLCLCIYHRYHVLCDESFVKKYLVLFAILFLQFTNYSS